MSKKIWDRGGDIEYDGAVWALMTFEGRFDHAWLRIGKACLDVKSQAAGESR